MSLSIFPSPSSHRESEQAAVGSRMEAATQALLRARNKVIAALDQQVAELQDIHRSLAYSPAPFVVVKESATASLSAESSTISGALAATSVSPRFPAPLMESPYGPSAHSTMAQSFSPLVPFQTRQPEHTIDPVLERATLDELNAALASAFASVSSRR